MCAPIAGLLQSWTMWAAISASGKQNRLRMKYPRKLCPLRSATRAGQHASATQMQSKVLSRAGVVPNTEITNPSHAAKLTIRERGSLGQQLRAQREDGAGPR